MNVIESILMAFDSIRGNKLRASLTLLSISVGVFAIIGAATLTNSIDSTVNDQLAELGENNFFIAKEPTLQFSGDRRKYRRRKAIVYSEIKEFKKRMTLTSMITSSSSSGGYTVKSGNNETDPDVSVIGIDENYLLMQNESISEGRPLSFQEIEYKHPVAIIGRDIVVKIFKHEDPIGKKIKIGSRKFEVAGVLEAKGATMGQSQDNKVLIPLTIFLKSYSSYWTESLSIAIRAESRELLEPTMDEAIGHMRSIRNCQPGDDNNFEIESNDAIADQFAPFTFFLSVFGIFCGVIALLVAGVGIMNIMLVTVKERTREIGIRKAVGAKPTWILLQFLIEAVTLCQVGGLIGIMLGLFVTSMAGIIFASSTSMNLSFAIPTIWIIASIGICTLMGLFFGAYPAWKAAKLNPIDALHYE